MKPLPHHYQVSIERMEPRRGVVRSAAKPDLLIGYPPEFDGEEGVWSPEHLFLSAVASCFMTTFLSIAEASHAGVAEYRGSVEGTVDRTPEGMAFTAVTLTVDVVADAAPERIERLIEKAKKSCIVANSLRMPLSVVANRGRTAA